MSEWILEIKDGSYADHEYVCDEWHRIELDLTKAKMTPLIRCEDCRYSHNWEPWVGDKLGHGECYRTKIGEAHYVHLNGFCAWGEPKEES